MLLTRVLRLTLTKIFEKKVCVSIDSKCSETQLMYPWCIHHWRRKVAERFKIPQSRWSWCHPKHPPKNLFQNTSCSIISNFPKIPGLRQTTTRLALGKHIISLQERRSPFTWKLQTYFSNISFLQIIRTYVSCRDEMNLNDGYGRFDFSMSNKRQIFPP